MGVIFLLLPVIWLIADASYPYVIESWRKLEESREAGGMPGLFLLKSILFVFCALLGLQALALAGRSALILAGDTSFLPPDEEREGV